MIYASGPRCLKTQKKSHNIANIFRSKIVARKVNFSRTKIGKNTKIQKIKWDILAYFKTMCTGILEDFNSWWIVDYCRNPRFLSPAEFGALLAGLVLTLINVACGAGCAAQFLLNKFFLLLEVFRIPHLHPLWWITFLLRQKLSKLELQ